MLSSAKSAATSAIGKVEDYLSQPLATAKPTTLSTVASLASPGGVTSAIAQKAVQKAVTPSASMAFPVGAGISAPQAAVAQQAVAPQLPQTMASKADLAQTQQVAAAQPVPSPFLGTRAAEALIPQTTQMMQSAAQGGIGQKLTAVASFLPSLAKETIVQPAARTLAKLGLSATGQTQAAQPKTVAQQALLGEEPVEPMQNTLQSVTKIADDLAKKQLEKTGQDPSSAGGIITRLGMVMPASVIGGFLEAANFDFGLGETGNKAAQKLIDAEASKLGRNLTKEEAAKIISQVADEHGATALSSEAKAITGEPVLGAAKPVTPVAEAEHLVPENAAYSEARKAVERSPLVPEAPAPLRKELQPHIPAEEGTALSDAQKIVTAKPEEKALAQKAVDAYHKAVTDIVSEYHPVAFAEKQISKNRAEEIPALTIDKKLELVPGAVGKAQGDLLEFRNLVADKLPTNAEDANTYLFLKRTVDRLTADPELKKVGTWTIDKANEALGQLKETMGPENFASLEKVMNGDYQRIMDEALQRQIGVTLTQDGYDAIKNSNDFYAPFKWMKYVSEDKGGLATGGKVASRAEVTKAIKGMSDTELGLQDILQQSASSIYRSRVIEEKSRAMQAVEELAKKDTENQFFMFPKDASEKPPAGFDTVTYYRDGKLQRMFASKDVAEALKGVYNKTQTDMLLKPLTASRSLFRAGATTYNAVFQLVNALAADAPRLGIISKYGVRSVQDLLSFPADWIYSLYSSMKSNLFKPNEVYMDFLKSGAANSSFQRAISPETFQETMKLERGKWPMMKNVLETPEKFANAIEETTKLTGLIRGMRKEGIKESNPLVAFFSKQKFTPKDAETSQKVMDALASEVRNYAGSPDFAAKGAKSGTLNLLFTFFNARVRGTTTDLARLVGKEGGGKEAMKTWVNLATLVGIPATTLWFYNNRPENKTDYEKRPQWEKDNYFLIPRDSYTINDAGEKVRDYYKIPKRETVQLFANLLEDSLTNARDKNPLAVATMGEKFLENISPINVQGKTLQERGASVVSSMNPAIKTLLEQIMNYDTFRKRPIVPDYLQARSPELQYFKSTPAAYVELGKYLGVSPLRAKAFIEGTTAGGLTQLIPQNAPGKEMKVGESPIIGAFKKRFTGTDVTDSSKIDAALLASEQAQADKRAKLSLEAEKTANELDAMKTKQERVAKLTELYNQNPTLYKKVIEVNDKRKLGWTNTDTRIQALTVKDGTRATAIWNEIKDMAPKDKTTTINDLIKKKIIDGQVYQQLKELRDGKPVTQF